MWLRRGAVTALLTTCILVAPAMAQSNELTGVVGRVFVSDQGIQSGPLAGGTLRFGKGLTVEANYARRLLSAELFTVSLEVPFVFDTDEGWHTTENPFGKYRALFFTPAARLNVFAHQAVSPWVSAGGGFGYFTVNALGTSNNSGVLQAGVGLDVKFAKQFSLRGEVRDFWSGVAPVDIVTGKSRQHNYLVGGGVVWHF